MKGKKKGTLSLDAARFLLGDERGEKEKESLGWAKGRASLYPSSNAVSEKADDGKKKERTFFQRGLRGEGVPDLIVSRSGGRR